MINYNNNILKQTQQHKKKTHNKSSQIHLSSTHLRKEQSYNEIYQKPIIDKDKEKSAKKTPAKSINKSKSNGKNSSQRLLTSYSQTKISTKSKNNPNESKKSQFYPKYLQQKLQTDRLNFRKSSEKYVGRNARLKTDYCEVGESTHQISTKNTSDHSSNVYLSRQQLERIRNEFEAIQRQNGILKKQLHFYRSKLTKPSNSITKALR